MEKIKLKNRLEISPVVHGHWRMKDWNLSVPALQKLINEVIDLGITTFDHADIYGDYECESLFGNVISQSDVNRKDIQIITKCGIKLLSDKYPDRKVKYYDYSQKHIVKSVENSLQNLKTDYIDLLLLHRPSPLLNPNEVAEVFDKLKKEGKVLQFGVSNFTPEQFESLQYNLDDPLVTNQIEISPSQLEHFDNGNLDFCLQHDINPMAWSPLAGGFLFSNTDDMSNRINKVIQKQAENHSCEVEEIIYAWLFKHPSRIIPIVGSGKIERIACAVKARTLNLSTEDWFEIYEASRGRSVA